ncbi:cytochrome P450 [Phascolomyces articulosus]|uniref:Cytochrome P450 n=1 Tax=Phascolomyces articulosus TaxID=60185 RepID=A0AAD5JU08_9FUNG|nr:cytochrome P450 [Phascolomyces articulosus]
MDYSWQSLWNKGVGILTSVSTMLLQKHHDANTDRKQLTLRAVSVLVGSYILWKIVLPRRSRRRSDIKMVSGGLPYLGHLLELTRDPIAFINRCKEENGPAFRIYLNGQDVTVLTGPLIRDMLRKPRWFSFEMGIQSIVPINRALKVSYDHKFKGEVLSSRDKDPIIYPIKHNFKPDQLGVFSERIQIAVNKMLNERLNLHPGEKRALPVWDILAVTVSQISCLCFCGSRVGYNQELVEAMANFTRNVIRTGLALSVLPGWVANFVIKRYLSVESQLDLTMDLLVPEMEKMRSREINQDDETTYLAMVLNLPKANGHLRTPKEAAFHFKNVVLASIHTTTHFTSFALHELACRPALVADLRTRIEKLDEITPETVGDIRLLDSLLREVLRYDVHVLGMNHMVKEDVALSTGQVIPQGELVLGAMLDTHTDPEMMTETVRLGSSTSLNQFDAYRFMHVDNADGDGMRSSTIGSEFLTFGLFAHACPGRYFAVNEIKYLLAELIMRYEITTHSGLRAKDFLMRGMTRFPPSEPLVFEGRKSTTNRMY